VCCLGRFWTQVFAVNFTVGVALYPNLVVSSLGAEYNLTIWKASSSRETLINLLIAAGIGMPLVLGYTVVTYRVFWKPARGVSGFTRVSDARV
jgi:cytochrome d ubiquinol oxidase subunit II